MEKILEGIDKEKVLTGPRVVQIDLTDKCNLNCIFCWVHSPLLDKKKIFPEGLKELSFKLVKNLIKELKDLGTEEIILSGSGEPFMYDKILEVIDLMKSYGFYLNIITNGLLINDKIAKFLVEKKVDLLTVSVSAAKPSTYLKLHPPATYDDFLKLKNNLKKISNYKNEIVTIYPHTKIYNVICNKNYREIEEMIDFAKEVDADSVEFQTIDIIENKTEFLALGNKEKEEIFEIFKRIRKRKDLIDYETPKGKKIKDFIKEEFSDFGKIWKNYKENFQLTRYAKELICPKGFNGERKIIFHTHSPYATRVSDFWYKFDFNNNCKECELKRKCFNEKEEVGKVDVKLLNLLNVESFLRKLVNLDNQNFTYRKDIDSIPCYIGWYYARILTNADVIPCCKAYKFALGNLYKDSFSQIWKSEKYNEFRIKAKNLSKKDKYFSLINCIKECDNWGMNMEIHKKFMEYKKEKDIRERSFSLVINADKFFEGNFNKGNHEFGEGLIIDGGEKRGYASYSITIKENGRYELWSKYASCQIRPVKIFIDGDLIKEDGLSKITGGWNKVFSKWFKEGEIYLKEGKHILKIVADNCIPHIEKFAFLKKEGKINLFNIKTSYLEKFKDILKKEGLKKAIYKLFYNLTPSNLKDRYLEILGILDKEYAYKGPFHVQIDLTNDCNSNCIACWCNSPLFKKPRLTPEEKKEYLSFSLVKEVLDELKAMHTTEIYYSGSGEPFMHPNILEILEYTKKKGFITHVNTNFTLVNKDVADKLIDIGVDFLTVSVWAGTPQVYKKVHLRDEEVFFRVKDTLLYLNKRKKQKYNKPLIKIYSVIFNMNYHEIEEIIKFAEDTLSESIEFTLVDTIPGVTDILRLNDKQYEELIYKFEKIKRKLDKNNRLPSGLLLFQFEQFLRRISQKNNVKEAKYDKNIIDSMPCYIGWLFARIIPNGEVHPCLKAHRIPSGSLYLNRFFEIWNSDKQKYFRKKTLVYEKKDSFFRLIGNDPFTKEAGCYKVCDDIGRNMWMHSRISMLTYPEKLLLKTAAAGIKILRKIKPKKEEYKMYHKDPLIAGILHGRKAFRGPNQVVIDITNKCNLNCIVCWLYSPFSKVDKDWLNEEISKDTLFRLIKDLKDIHTERIRFTGGGEPFMCKYLIEAIEFARKNGLLVSITTNFGLVSKKDIKRLVDLEVDELCISIWAKNKETYLKTHPSVSEKYFENLKENLLYLKEIKRKKPRVTFANVIMNLNYKEFDEMYEFAKEYGADAIYFTLPDVFRDEIKRFLLSDKEKEFLIRKAEKMKMKAKKDKIELEFFEGFIRRLSKKEEFTKGEYDKDDIDKIPCYVGWIFSRILADGNVVPCCRAVNKIMGNVNKTSFKDIWYSQKYNEFRAKAKFLKKTHPFFKDIGCIKECDNFMHNLEIHRKLNNVLI